MNRLDPTFKKALIIIVSVAVGIWLIKKLISFLGFSGKYKWGVINYWIVKKSHGYTHKEMTFIKRLGELFKVPGPAYLMGNISSFDHYVALYLINLYKKKMNHWVRVRLAARILEIRRKFAIIPLSSSKVRHSRQLAAGSRVRIGIKGKGYFDSMIGESRYTYFTAMIPNDKIATLLKNESKVICRVKRVGDAQYVFNSKVHFVSSATSPMFVQLKHTRGVKRQQQRKDERHKTQLYCKIAPVTLTRTKKGFIFPEKPGTVEYSGYLRDLSSGGISIQTRDHLEPGQYYKIKFRLLGEDLEIPARVLRYYKLNKSTEKAFSHLKFVGMPLNARVLIQMYVYKLHPSYFKRGKK